MNPSKRSYCHAQQWPTRPSNFFGDTSCQNSDGLYIQVPPQTHHDGSREPWNVYRDAPALPYHGSVQDHTGVYSAGLQSASEQEGWKRNSSQLSASDDWTRPEPLDASETWRHFMAPSETSQQSMQADWRYDLPLLPRNADFLSQETPSSSSTSRPSLTNLLNPAPAPQLPYVTPETQLELAAFDPP